MAGLMLNGCAWKAGVEDDMANAAAEKNKPVVKADEKADEKTGIKPVDATKEKTTEAGADQTKEPSTGKEKATDKTPDTTNN